MSSDPTRPLPPPEWNPDSPAKQHPPGGQPRPTFTPNEQYQPPQPPPTRQQPPYQPPEPAQPQYQYDQAYQETPAGRVRRRRRRWPMVTGVVVIVLLLLAVGADRFAAYEAENQMANQIEQSGLPVKPHVTIKGFPFLTQLVAKDFKEVDISASNVTEGPLTIASINATLHGMHLIDGFTGARIDNLNGSALITFQALANAGGFPSAVTLGPGASSDQIKATVSVPLLGNTSATVQVTKVSARKFNVRVVNAGGIESSLLGNLVNYTYTLPQLPAGMNIHDINVTQQGVVISISAQNTTLTQPS